MRALLVLASRSFSLSFRHATRLCKFLLGGALCDMTKNSRVGEVACLDKNVLSTKCKTTCVPTHI